MRPSIESLKRQDKRLANSTGCSHSEALDQIARGQGFNNWSLLAKHDTGSSSSAASFLAALKTSVVNEIIALAERERAASDEINRKHGIRSGAPFSPADPKIIEAMVDHIGSPERAALHRRVQDLTEDERMELIAVMWLGRGDGSVRNWRALVKEAHNMSDEGDVPYICGKAPLPEYLRQGLRKLAAKRFT